MVETITLSLPAVDVLGSHLNLNVRQYPFEIPRPTGSAEECDRAAQRVWSELESTGTVRSGRTEPEVEDALYLLSSSEVAIAAAGLVDVRSGQRLAARVVSTGEVGVLGVIDQRGLRMSFLDPHDLPGVCVDLLPEAPPGAGRTVHASAQRTGGRSPADAEIDGLDAMRAVTARPKFRLGHFLVGSDRKRTAVPSLTWFDNDSGRYMLVGERDSAEQDALTCSPAGNDELAGQLDDLLDRVRGG